MVISGGSENSQAEVIFVIECTAVNGAYINELKTNYIIPTLEYFHGGPLEEGRGAAGACAVYGAVVCRAADCAPAPPCYTLGPYSAPQQLLAAIDRLLLVGGRGESGACLAEALGVALSCLEELSATRRPGADPPQRHVLLMCTSPPYPAAAGGLTTYGGAATAEQAAAALGERGACVSIVAPRKLPALLRLFERAGGDLAAAQARNYAKDPRHLVLLRGFSLKERPPSPAPPPAPDSTSIAPPTSEPQIPPYRPTSATVRPPAPPFSQAPPAYQVNAARPQRWIVPPQAVQRPNFGGNSALISQLAQPPYPPQQNQQGNVQGQMRAQAPVPPQSSAPVQAGPSMPLAPGAPQPQRTFIWSGVLEWIDKNKGPGEQQKVSKHLMCQVSANSKDTEPELKADTWPNKLLMQLMPKQLIGSIGGHYLKDSKSVLFHLQPGEALDSLTKVMVGGFAGCVHFQPLQTTPQCEIKVLILLYTADKKTYIGFIPNNQITFVDRLRKVIQQQKMSQMLTQKGGPGPSPGLPGPPAPQQHPQQGQVPQMMVNQMGPQGVNQVGPQGQVGPPIGGPSQVSGPPQARAQELESARIQNLEKIQQLQQTLEAAQQQEAQYKSQMEIMSHLKQTLQVAQQQEQQYKQQEQHYKQLQEQDQRQAQQQQQIQSQIQQQMVGPGVGVPGGMGGVGGPGGMGGGQVPPHMPPNRHMRPHMPTNPGLRHLLQQQPQYRPGSVPRPPTSAPNPQQFDDNTFDFLQ